MPWEMRPYQIEAIRQAIKIRYGVIHHPTGSGKTIAMAGLIHRVGIPGIIMVPSRMLLHQTADVMEEAFPMLDIGRIGDKEFSVGDITVGTSDSLFLKQHQVADWVDKRHGGNLKFLFTDEAHHVRESQKDVSTRYFDVALSIDASIKIGFTATPGDPGTLKRKLLEGVTGGVIHRLSGAEARRYGIIVGMEVFVFNVNGGYNRTKEWRTEYEENLLKNESYHKLVCSIAKELAKTQQVLIIVDRVEKHLFKLDEMLPEAVPLYGDTPKDERDKIVVDFEKGDIKILISTIVKEGVNIKSIEAIIMASGGRDSDALIQKIGRGLRYKEGKEKLVLVDFMFPDGILQKHSKARIKVYKDQGYDIKRNARLDHLTNGGYIDLEKAV
jgi:superfamily II DNA or RNA helicase